MNAQTVDIKSSVAEQTRRLSSVEKMLGDHKKDTHKKLGNLERKVHEADTKHTKAIETIEQRLAKLECGEARCGANRKTRGVRRRQAQLQRDGSPPCHTEGMRAKDAERHNRRAGYHMASS